MSKKLPTYKDAIRGITYRIVGFLGENKDYESYHGKSFSPKGRDIIIHVLRNGDSKRYDVKPIAEAIIAIPKSLASGREQVNPWVGDQLHKG